MENQEINANNVPITGNTFNFELNSNVQNNDGKPSLNGIAGNYVYSADTYLDNKCYSAQLNPQNTSVTGGTVNDYCYSYTENIDKPKKLSIAQLKKYKGLSDINDEQAIEIIDGLFQLSLITYKIYKS